MSEEADLQVKTMKEGSVTVPKELKVTYKEGLKLSDADLSSTGWTWADGDAALTVGTGEYPAYFDTSGLENTHDFSAVAGTENYTGLEAVQEFVIKKAIPTPDEVTGLIIVQGHPLSELELPEQFRWEDETQIAEELGTHPFKAIYTPEDIVNYETVETKIDVQVVPALSVINHVPTISASDKTIKFGEKFDPLKDVTAKDKEDGDLTSEINVVKNTVDTGKAGTYEVVYQVADSQNASVRKTIKIHVKAEEKPEDPNTPDKDDIPDKGDMPDKGNTPDQNGADKENADANKSVQTGDRTNVLLWVMLLGVSSVGLLCGLYRKKR